MQLGISAAAAVLVLSAFGCAEPLGVCRISFIPFENPDSIIPYVGSADIAGVTEETCDAIIDDPRINSRSGSGWDDEYMLDGTVGDDRTDAPCPGRPNIEVSQDPEIFCDLAESLLNEGSDLGHRLTCHDGRVSVEQCVHYTFDSIADRDSFYGDCAGLTSRTRDAHNCPSGATGNGYCRQMAPGRATDTHTYTGSASELQARCASTGGTWRSF